MYSTQWCGYCHRLKSQLDREGIAYEVVDIERVPDAAFIVEQVNRGNQTVPTLVYADGWPRPTRPSPTSRRSSPRDSPERLTRSRAAGRRTTPRPATG